MNYYYETGGGLGDIIQKYYEHDPLGTATALSEDDTLTIAVVSHNPFSDELFRFFPDRERLRLLCPGYWNEEDQERRMRQRYALPPYAAGEDPYTPLPALQGGRAVFYPAPGDLLTIAEKVTTEVRCCGYRGYVVIARSAGLPDRDLPDDITCAAHAALCNVGFLPVYVGRTYDRHGRTETLPVGLHGYSVDLVDRMTVPGVVALVKGSAGVVTCHSAVNMMASYERKPQLLLYPESVKARHFTHLDQWSFMQHYLEVSHGTFDAFNTELLADFIREVTDR